MSFVGIYVARTDGDFDFAAALDTERPESKNWLDEIREWYQSEGEETVTLTVDSLAKLPDVLTADAYCDLCGKKFPRAIMTVNYEGNALMCPKCGEDAHD
jgi:hypothetical protein